MSFHPQSVRNNRHKLPVSFLLFLLLGGLLPLLAILPIRVVGASIGTYFFLIFLLLSLTKVSYKKEVIETKSSMFIPLVALWSVITIQLIIHPFDMRQIFYYIIIFLIFFVAMRAVFSPDISTVRQLIKWLKYGALVSFAFGTIQYVFDLQLYTPEMLDDILASHRNGGPHRASGGMLSPNGYGYYAALMSALFFSELYHLPNRYLANKKFVYNLLFFMISVFQLFISQSRSALLGLLVAIFLVYLTKQQKKVVLLKNIAMAFLSLTFIVLTYFSFIESLENFFIRTGNDPRWILWDAGIQHLVSNPEIIMIGLGIGDSNREMITFSDNFFIELLLTGGLPLLIAFLWFILTPVCKKSQYLKLTQRFPEFSTMINMWKVIFLVASIFSSAIGFLPFTPIYFFGVFFASRLAISINNRKGTV